MASRYLTAAEQVMLRYRRPFKAKELVSVAREEGLLPRTFRDGLEPRTPWETMETQLALEIRKNGSDARFVRTGPGMFYLRALTDKRFEGRQYAKPKASETVMCINMDVVDATGPFQGIRASVPGIERAVSSTSELLAVPRIEAEQSLNMKQLLSYVMIERNGQVLCFQRGTYSRVEQQLMGRDCIGFGGHLTASDQNLFNGKDAGFRQNVLRELREEIRLPEIDVHRLAEGIGLEQTGWLNDDSSWTGRRHIAGVFRYTVSDDPSWESPAYGEQGVTKLRWIDTDQSAPLKNFEYWSQLCVRHFYPGMALAAPTFEIRRRRVLTNADVIAIIGPIGSGKSATARVLSREFGFRYVNSGEVLAGLMGIPPIPATERVVFQELATSFVSTHQGVVRFAEALAEAAGSGPAVIEGIRNESTLAEIGRRRVTAAIFVETPADVAYEFFTRREGASGSVEQFLRARESPGEAEVDGLKDSCDAVIHNWSGRRSHRQVVRSLMKELGRHRVGK